MKMRFNVELGLHERHADPYLAVMCHRGIHIKHVVNRHDEEWQARAQWRRLQVKSEKARACTVGFGAVGAVRDEVRVLVAASRFGLWSAAAALGHGEGRRRQQLRTMPAV
jgi:hypothetical protein